MSKNEQLYLRLQFRLPSNVSQPTIAEQLPITILGVQIQALPQSSEEFQIECTATDAVERIQAVLTALSLSGDADVRRTTSVLRIGGAPEHMGRWWEDEFTPNWGHDSNNISANSISFARRHGEAILGLQCSATFNRVTNALHYYNSGLGAQSDVATVLFTTVLEALLCNATSELTFRLALAASNWLGGDFAKRHEAFETTRSLYSKRSKIVHGDKVATHLESAAIELSENTVPSLERLARSVLRRIFDLDLVDFFRTTTKLDEFFTVQSLGMDVESALRHVGYSRVNPAK